MNPYPDSDSLQGRRIHPLVASAAVAVILVSATGIAAITGILPSSHAVQAPAAQLEPAAAQVASTPAVSPPAVAAPRSTEAPPQTYVHHRHPAPVEQARSGDRDAWRNPSQPARQAVTADPYAGEVVAVNTVETPEPTTGVGAVGGAVAGGLIGNQIGNGRGRLLATIAGAVGGGFAGNGIEHAVRKETSYQVQVRMQDGSYRNFSYPTQPPVQVGERVHVSGDSLVAS
ncbi:glycine zipper 2TM domain-containing protein [Trinickia terrae]|uniref:Glycine zipper 2TM domain-containing protein n=1 Tax=Trinickia terrae TaxID=2571161 RepID=A0A4V5PHE1_9BURK|nr:glycine zipper 2TM domain-containing protein [Trinickia terrae]TKC83000.1 glycine zipper 2TM domain-containing protein [Trinickia terrae]